MGSSQSLDEIFAEDSRICRDYQPAFHSLDLTEGSDWQSAELKDVLAALVKDYSRHSKTKVELETEGL